MAALGSSDRALDLERVELRIGREVVFAAGEPTGSMDAAARAMTADDLVVACKVGDGPGVAELLTTDLSPDYVRLNAFGST
jgi:N-acetylglutamate synthase/N-acetylornithine aminotransferase